MLVIQRPDVEVSPSEIPNRQQFSIGPLEPGFGHTIGNSLRRALLSSIPGAAVTHVRFDDAIHEFGTIQGVATDITDIILNLKDLVINLLCEDPVTLRLDIRGPADVSAGDILPHTDVEILNPELWLAAVDGHDRLAADITVNRGWGYVSAEVNKESSPEIGVIPVDSIYSPVRRVAFNVDTTRVAQSTDYDLLLLDVETDGSISPRDAVASAAATLGSLLAIIEELSDEPEGLTPQEIVDVESPEDTYDVLLDEIGLKERARNCLKRSGIEILGDLIHKTRQDLLKIPNFGEKSLMEVVNKLAEFGLTLKGEVVIVRPEVDVAEESADTTNVRSVDADVADLDADSSYYGVDVDGIDSYADEADDDSSV